MNDRNYYLTDELERQLVLAEMEEQFRPRPLKALVALLKRIGAHMQRSRTEQLKTQTA